MEESLFLIFAPQSYKQIPCQTSYQQLFSQKNYFFYHFLPFRKQKRHFAFIFAQKSTNNKQFHTNDICTKLRNDANFYQIREKRRKSSTFAPQKNEDH